MPIAVLVRLLAVWVDLLSRYGRRVLLARIVVHDQPLKVRVLVKATIWQVVLLVHNAYNILCVYD